MFSPVALTRPTTSPGNASSIVVRSAPNTVDAYFVANGLPVRSQVITMPRSNRPEQMRAKAMRSRWLRSMLACTLNTNAEHGSSRWRGLPSTSARGVGAGARSTIGVEEVADTEVGERRSGEHRGGLAGEERRQVDVGADRVEQRRVVDRLGPLVRPPPPRPGSASTSSSGAICEPRAVRVKRVKTPVRRSITPRRSPCDPTGHVAGVGRRPICSSIWSSSSSGSIPGRSSLLRNVITGRFARAADLEQLQRLRFDALGRVEHHHHGVDGGQHAVGVLGEVAVAGRVEQVQFVIAVREVERRRGDRDPALLLHVHPVGRRRPPALVRLDRTARRDRTGVQQELLGRAWSCPRRGG